MVRHRCKRSAACHQLELPRPYCLLLTGDWQAVAQSWQDLGAPFEQAMSLLLCDRVAQQSALAILESLGASATVARVRDWLRRDGVRLGSHGPRTSTRTNAWGLTRRQLDVLRLVDAGHSNCQIAEVLFISAKTVDHHISAILDKLDARSRGEAAAFARSSGLQRPWPVWPRS